MFFSGLICPLWFAYVYKFLRPVALTSICLAIKSQQYFNRRRYVKWNSHKTLISSLTDIHMCYWKDVCMSKQNVFNWFNLLSLIFYCFSRQKEGAFPFSVSCPSFSFFWVDVHRTSGSTESLNLCRTSCHNWSCTGWKVSGCLKRHALLTVGEETGPFHILKHVNGEFEMLMCF